jgi:simple sugar transport system permease protein
MTDAVQSSAPAQAARSGEWADRLRIGAEYLVIPIFADLVSAALFSIFLLFLGKSPLEFYALLWRGGFGTAFSWQNTLLR